MKISMAMTEENDPPDVWVVCCPLQLGVRRRIVAAIPRR